MQSANDNVVSIDDQGLLSGVVDFENANALKTAGESLIVNAKGAVRFDLSGISAANSVTVALLAGWLRCAELKGITIGFDNIPPKLRAIVEVCGLDDVLPIADA